MRTSRNKSKLNSIYKKPTGTLMTTERTPKKNALLMKCKIRKKSIKISVSAWWCIYRISCIKKNTNINVYISISIYTHIPIYIFAGTNLCIRSYLNVTTLIFKYRLVYFCFLCHSYKQIKPNQTENQPLFNIHSLVWSWCA